MTQRPGGLPTRKLVKRVCLFLWVSYCCWYTACSSSGLSFSLRYSTSVALNALNTSSDNHSIGREDRAGTDPLKVAIIGGAGNIGSYLTLKLGDNHRFHVVPYDKDPQIADLETIQKHSKDMNQEELQEFRIVIFLGGCTGRNSCAQLSPSEIYQENVQSVIDVVQKMDSRQHFIAASTSAVMEGTDFAKEEDPVQQEFLDEYSSSMRMREMKLQELVAQSSLANSLPRITLFRFGTVVGNSPGQRTDLMVPSFFKAAYTHGILQVKGHRKMRPFLTLDDLSRAFCTVMTAPSSIMTLGDHVAKFKIWHLSSFNATVLKVAATVASMTGASIDMPSDEAKQHIDVTPSTFQGFSLDASAFSKHFNFTFDGTLSSAMEDMEANMPESVIPKGAHLEVLDSVQNVLNCPVCGSSHQQTVLDLGSQPLANDFNSNSNASLTSPRFPLKLVRCRTCNHYHLSHVVDRGNLFSNYLYQSGTSSTLSEYFEWLALKVIDESDEFLGGNGSVLEIACNDGSQLDHFKAHGWKTYGVDPAANLVEIARSKNHTVKTGFWPLSFPELLPRGGTGFLTAIVAQNVLAHVPDVIAFLKGCVEVMGPKTKLYIQTSQCNMQQLGQFDTIYHEHISFFTGHSFLQASIGAGLVITSFETTPIHGESCLVTIQLPPSGAEMSAILSPTLNDRLSKEKHDGITNDFFAARFAARANKIQEWLRQELLHFKSKGFHVGAYGAAAKGMVLLHFMLDQAQIDGHTLVEFVLDDAPLKQHTYCPGTSIPVLQTDSIKNMDVEKPLVLIIFAWNFYDEISQKVKNSVIGKRKEVFFIIPFPTPRTVRLLVDQNRFDKIRDLPFHPTVVPNPIRDKKRKKVILVTHQRNEELLMPFFIIQHAPMFDRAILIDFNSTDRTREIIEIFAPPSWTCVASTTGQVFDAAGTDQQVVDWEKQYPDDWVVALTTTEFLVKPSFRQYLANILQHPVTSPPKAVAKIPAVIMIGDDREPLFEFKPLAKQRKGYSAVGASIYSRYIHIGTSNTYIYSIGRHKYEGKDAETVNLEGAFIMKWKYAPWPEVIPRMMSVGATIPESDKVLRFGGHHSSVLNNRKALRRMKAKYVGQSEGKRFNFCDFVDDELSLFSHWAYNHAYGPCEPALPFSENETNSL